MEWGSKKFVKSAQSGFFSQQRWQFKGIKKKKKKKRNRQTGPLRAAPTKKVQRRDLKGMKRKEKEMKSEGGIKNMLECDG